MGLNDSGGRGDEAIIGRRAADGDYLSVREAVRMFASKEEVASLNTAIQGMSHTVSQLPTRDEVKLRAQRDDERIAVVKQNAEDMREELRTALAEVKIDVKAMRANQLPGWVLPAVGVIIAVASFFGSHWKW